MAHTGRLELDFVDVHGERVHDALRIRLRHHTLPEERRVTGHDGRQVLEITELRRDPQGLYRLEVDARCYWPVARFITIPATGHLRERVTLPIRPDHAKPLFPTYVELDDRVRSVLERSAAVLGHEGLTGQPLYDALSDEATAALLNISKKSLVVPFRDGADLLALVTIEEIREDRCFVSVPVAVMTQVDELVAADQFRPVDGALHDPPAGFVRSGSFKTLDAFGNLQMTFFRAGERCVADIDIDDAAGLLHVFQVVRNRVTGKPTHPYNIHQILMKHQHLDPGYRLVPRAT